MITGIHKRTRTARLSHSNNMKLVNLFLFVINAHCILTISNASSASASAKERKRFLRSWTHYNEEDLLHNEQQQLLQQHPIKAGRIGNRNGQLPGNIRINKSPDSEVDCPCWDESDLESIKDVSHSSCKNTYNPEGKGTLIRHGIFDNENSRFFAWEQNNNYEPSNENQDYWSSPDTNSCFKQGSSTIFDLSDEQVNACKAQIMNRCAELGTGYYEAANKHVDTTMSIY